MRQNDPVRHRTAVGRLRTIAERCQQVSGLWEDREPPLRAAYAFGAVLDGTGDLDVVQVAFVLDDPPAEELTWFARPTSCSSLPYLLEIEKAPVE